MRLAVSSLRVDAVASDALRLSRTKIAPLIRAGKCRVNWKKTEDPAQQLAAGDVVSVRGFGRFKVLNIEGLTKKGKIRVVIGKFA
jgi:RNA-binding protein YlmH